VRKWWHDRWQETKPTDLISIVVAVVSLAIALSAFKQANHVAEKQAEAAAPILAPGSALAQRGEPITVTTENAVVEKRADRLFLDTSRPTGARFVVPLRNGGSGIALTIGVPVLVADCTNEPPLLPRQAITPPLGTYVIPSGASDQLAYAQPPGKPMKGNVPNHPEYWYSFDYRAFASPKPPHDLLMWYTDGAKSKLRWTCIQYQRTAGKTIRRPKPMTINPEPWTVLAQHYGIRAMVPLEPKSP
jgi:hypothetical protein